jgi:anti-sigma factor RsiW
MARVTIDELARYRDGELSASARKRIEEALRTSPTEDRAHVEKLDRLGDLLRVMHEEQASQVSFDGFANRVEVGIRAAEKPGLGERLGVWFAEFFEHRRVVWIPAASLVGAAAAVLLVLPLVHGPQPAAPLPQGVAGGIWAASTTESAMATAVPTGSEAVLANRGQVTGWEFTVPNDRGEPIGVVWVND